MTNVELKQRSDIAFGTRSEIIYFYPYAVRCMVSHLVSNNGRA